MMKTRKTRIVIAILVISIVFVAGINSCYNISKLFDPSSAQAIVKVVGINTYGTDFIIETQMEDDKPKSFYINRGTEQGLSIDTFKKHMLHKAIRIYFNQKFKHTATVDTILLNDTVYYYRKYILFPNP